MSDTKAPIEGKVYASTLGSLLGAVSGFLLWGLGVVAFGAPADAAHATQAAAAVPAPISALLLVVLPPLGAFVGGYVAKHTPRAAVVAEEDSDDIDPGVADTPGLGEPDPVA